MSKDIPGSTLLPPGDPIIGYESRLEEGSSLPNRSTPAVTPIPPGGTSTSDLLDLARRLQDALGRSGDDYLMEVAKVAIEPVIEALVDRKLVEDNGEDVGAVQEYACVCCSGA